MRRSGIYRREFCIGLATAMAVAALLPAHGAADIVPRGNDVIGAIRHVVAKQDDTLLDLARANNLGFTDIVAANPEVDPWVPAAGTEIVLPTAHVLPQAPRKGLVLNIADQRLYYFPDAGPAESLPIGVGVEGWKTPLGTTRVVRKQVNPSWYVPKSIRAEKPELPAVVPPGPDNPLGTHALYLGWPSYALHGTNQPWGVGRRVSHGCIRLYPEDIVKLYPRIAIGTQVTVVMQPIKLGWSGNQLYVEAHPTPAQADELEEDGKFAAVPAPDLEYLVTTAAGNRVGEIDWPAVRRAAAERRGIPVPVLQGAPEPRAARPDPKQASN